MHDVTSPITGNSTVCACQKRRDTKKPASLAPHVCNLPVTEGFPHKRPVMGEVFPCHKVFMTSYRQVGLPEISRVERQAPLHLNYLDQAVIHSVSHGGEIVRANWWNTICQRTCRHVSVSFHRPLGPWFKSLSRQTARQPSKFWLASLLCWESRWIYQRFHCLQKRPFRLTTKYQKHCITNPSMGNPPVTYKFAS